MPTCHVRSTALLPDASGQPQSPRWSLSHDRDVLSLSHDMGGGSTCLALSAAQARQLRALGAATACVRMAVGPDNGLDLFLIGKKTGIGLWGGLASRADDVDAVVGAMQKALAFAEQIVSEVNSLVVVIDRNFKLRRFNRVGEERSGLRESDLVGVDAHKLFMPTSHHADSRAHIADFFERGESYETVGPVNTPHGMRQIHWRNKLVQGGSDEDTYLVCSGIDITNDLANRQRLHDQAHLDASTGLPNGLASRQQMEAAVDSRQPVTLVALVLMKYRLLRGLLGLAQCEQLMMQVATALLEALPPHWVLSRPGGPEFRLHAVGARTDEELVALGELVLRVLSNTFHVGGVQLRLHVSLGIARLPEHAATVDDLATAADAAMHVAMDRSDSRFEIYASRMRDGLAEGLWLDAHLHEAQERSQLELWYQPKVCLRNGAVASVEALIRWKHPQAGYIPPDRFIPRAEATGAVVRLGRWVMHAAAAQARAWSDAGMRLRVSVNVSAKQVTNDRSLAQVLQQAQQACGGLIDVELTESSFLEDAQAARAFIAACRALGCGVHLDDFGTGYSSLGQLAGLELTAVKLDRTFIADGGGHGPRQQALLAAISSLCQALGLPLVAEGVETPEVADRLRSIGVQYAQGWLYSKALPAPALADWLQRRRDCGP